MDIRHKAEKRGRLPGRNSTSADRDKVRTMRSSVNIFYVLMSPRRATVSEVCLAAVWVVRLDWRFMNACGLLLDLRGNYTELIKNKVAGEVYKSNVSHVTMLWP